MPRQVKKGNGAATNVTYDSLGNIKSKGDMGNYSYGAGLAGPHAVTSVTGFAGKDYLYDKNGNNLDGDGRTLHYSSFQIQGTVYLIL